MSDEKVHVHWHEHSVTRDEREQLNKHKGCVIWFTGLSACGKSTICEPGRSQAAFARPAGASCSTATTCATGLNAAPAMLKERHGEEFAKRFGLGFSAQDREENIRRIGAVAELFCQSGTIALDGVHQPLSPRSRRRPRPLQAG